MRDSLHYHTACGCVSRPRAEPKIFQHCHEQRGGAHVVGEQSLLVKTEFRRARKLPHWTNLAVSPTALHIAGSSGDACSAERRAWRRLVGKNRTAVLVASPRLGRVSLATWPLVRRTGWARHQQVFDSASNRDKCLLQFGGTPPLLVCLCRSTACCLPSQGIRWTCPPHPSQIAMDASWSNSMPGQSICGPRAVYAQLFFFFFFFFFLKLALRLRSRPPPPQTHVLRFASFCELLRRPLTTMT